MEPPAGKSGRGGEVSLAAPGHDGMPVRHVFHPSQDNGDGLPLNGRSRPLITVWLEVRILPGPPRSPMRTDVSPSLTNSPQFAGVFAGSTPGVRSLSPAEVAIASILAAGLWALQTRSWRRPELPIKTPR